MRKYIHIIYMAFTMRLFSLVFGVFVERAEKITFIQKIYIQMRCKYFSLCGCVLCIILCSFACNNMLRNHTGMCGVSITLKLESCCKINKSFRLGLLYMLECEVDNSFTFKMITHTIIIIHHHLNQPVDQSSHSFLISLTVYSFFACVPSK